jgi:hypothetical protein
MYKPNTKKMLTVLITVAMVFSALAILSFATTPASATATGVVTYNPTTFGESLSGTTYTMTPTVVVANGGTFGSGSTVYFYVSTTTSASGIVAPFASYVGSVTLPGGATSLSNTAVTLFSSNSGSTNYAGSYYLLASDSSSTAAPAQFSAGTAITIVSTQPTLVLNPPAATVGSTVKVTGTGWDAGASVSVYLNYAASGTVLLTTTVGTNDAISASFTVPALSGTETATGGSITGVSPYEVVAQETNSLSATYPMGGITASTTFNVLPSITVSPASINGAKSSTFTMTGTGFLAGETIAAFTSTSSGTSQVTIGPSSVQAYVSAATVDSTGSVTISVTGLANTLSSGPNNIVITFSGPSVTDTFSNAIYVSSPNLAALHLTFTTSSPVYPGDSATAAVYNFPASTPVNVYLGSYLVTSLTTDANGFASASTTIPYLPAGTYTPMATAMVSSASVSTTTTAVKVSSFFQVTDPSGTMLISTSNEYVPADGSLTVFAAGLNPLSSYAFTDSAIGLIPEYAASINVVNGTVTSSYDITPGSNGVVNFTYVPGYTGISTSTSESITVTGVTGMSGDTFGYLVVGALSIGPTFGSPSSVFVPSSTSSSVLTISGLIPQASNTYPTISPVYNVFFGTTELTFGTGTSATTKVTSATTLSFTVPSLAGGINNISVNYNGNATSLASAPELISSPATSFSAVNVEINTTLGYIYGYNLDSGATYTLYVSGFGTVSTPSVTVGASTGAFFVSDAGLLATQAGTYLVELSGTLSSSTLTATTSYSVSVAMAKFAAATTEGATQPVSLSGLTAGVMYSLDFAGSDVLDFTASGSTAAPTITIPLVPAGNYTVALTQFGSTTVLASQVLQIEANPDLTLSADPQQAFPTELVTFSATLTQPTAPANGVLTGSYALISLNGTLVAKVPATYASGALSGSFQMINGAPGSYYTLSVTGLDQYTVSTAGADTGTVYVPYASSVSDYFALVSGAGALITGFNTAQLTAIIQTAVGNAMKVPLSELNASVIAIKNATAQIKTAFGTMTSTLAAINATVAGIQSGQVLVQTDLGSIMTSFASLNASIATFNGDVATINTTLGQVKASLSSIGTQVTTNGNGIATITTDLGTLSGTVTSTSNGVSQIQTNLGDLNATVQTVKNQTSGFPTLEIFLIVIIVLVLITLVISFLAVSAANKAARKASEERKQ